MVDPLEEPMFPGLSLSSNNLSDKMTALGFRRRDMVAFMREFVPTKNAYMLFDGTATVCNSANIHEAQRGYNSHGLHDPQVNLVYAAAICEERLLPVSYKRFPGGIRDLSAYESIRNGIGAKQYIAISDKGFVKEKDQRHMEDLDIAYLAPLKRNSTEYARTPLEKPGLTGFQGRFTYNGRIVWYYEQPVGKDAKHRYILYLDETLRHLEQSTVRERTTSGTRRPKRSRRSRKSNCFAARSV